MLNVQHTVKMKSQQISSWNIKECFPNYAIHKINRKLLAKNKGVINELTIIHFAFLYNVL